MSKRKRTSEECDRLYATKTKYTARPYKLPMEYIEALADRITSVNPTKEILINTLTGFWSVGFTRGYSRRLSDSKFFKEGRERALKESWDEFITEIEDTIHPKQIQSN
jgi:hypothetical protein